MPQKIVIDLTSCHA